MVLTDHQMYQILTGIEAKLAALDKHTATGLSSLDANLKLHQQETRHYRHGILSRLDAVEKTLEEWKRSTPKPSLFPGAIAVLTSPMVLKALFAVGAIFLGYSLGEVGDMIAKFP